MYTGPFIARAVHFAISAHRFRAQAYVDPDGGWLSNAHGCEDEVKWLLDQALAETDLRCDCPECADRPPPPTPIASPTPSIDPNDDYAVAQVVADALGLHEGDTPGDWRGRHYMSPPPPAPPTQDEIDALIETAIQRAIGAEGCRRAAVSDPDSGDAWRATAEWSSARSREALNKIFGGSAMGEDAP